MKSNGFLSRGLSRPAQQANLPAHGPCWPAKPSLEASAASQRSVFSAFAVTNTSSGSVTAKDERGELPYRMVRNEKFYLDELDVISFLDSYSFLRPFDSDTYSPGAFLWKKIADIDGRRRRRLLDLMEPRHMVAMWDIAQDCASNPDDASPRPDQDVITLESIDSERKDVLQSANDMLPSVYQANVLQPEIWDGKVSGLPWPLDGMSRFQKAFFIGRDGRRYGRVMLQGSPTRWLGDRLTPLYFEVLPASEVLATEDIAQVSFDYADGHLHLNKQGCLPKEFPKALAHPMKFDDDMRDYVCAAGPGVLVGQTWQEGRAEDSMPKKFLGEFVLVRR